MKTISAADAARHFSELIDAAQDAPVVVTRGETAVGVLFSLQDIENTVWGELARKAAAEGFIGTEESGTLIAALTNAED